MLTPNVPALLAACKVLADVINDVAAGSTVDGYANILPDLITLLPQIGEIGTEAKSLATSDYETLVSQLAGYLNLGTGKAESVLQASIKLLADLQPVVIDVQALIAAAK
jgi:hypothetical protein